MHYQLNIYSYTSLLEKNGYEYNTLGDQKRADHLYEPEEVEKMPNLSSSVRLMTRRHSLTSPASWWTARTSMRQITPHNQAVLL